MDNKERKIRRELKEVESLLLSLEKKQMKIYNNVYNRSKDMRLSPTQSQLQMKYLLKEIGYEYEFKKIMIGGNNYPIVDFYIPELKLVLDVVETESPDDILKRKNRDETLNGLGYTKILLLTSTVVANLTKDDLISKLSMVGDRERKFVIVTKRDKLRKKIKKLQDKLIPESIK